MQQTTMSIDVQLDVQLLDMLETKLGRLAAHWRGTQDAKESQMLVQQYQAVLRFMIELGYHDSLDADAELPDEYLPAEYLALHN
jgi:hypothetical protein